MKETRLFRKWTIDDLVAVLAEQGCHLTAQAISSWERGQTAPRPHHQIAVARALSVPHGVLFAITDQAA